jgi:hypothetical protein
MFDKQPEGLLLADIVAKVFSTLGGATLIQYLARTRNFDSQA